MNLALIHSTACRDLLNDGELEDAVRYCISQGIKPPVPPCAKDSPDYLRCVEVAKETMSDYGWWEKRLKVQHARGRKQAADRERLW
ncbi:hypothetical protein [Pseudoduganella violaceinigra]|uniref:hypothetical protein n=1 Tax=Pseudoduganella violaceinigra TaxID=246602 RepID=UPI0004870A95|nr:hypothetical protein [Pseudoduganella violaceinigra]